MKKMISLLLSIMLLSTVLTACGPKEPSDPDTSTALTSQISQEDSSPTSASTEWGVNENIITERNDVNATAHIKFPSLAGITKGQAKIAYQPDYSLVILGSEIDFNKPTVVDDKIENIFPAYFVKTIETMKAYRRIDHDNFNFEITNKKTVTINDYEMCKYTGKHTFTVNGTPKSIAFVAYATKLKANDAAVYWMVLDDTADQTLGSTIESHADNMAKSFHE